MAATVLHHPQAKATWMIKVCQQHGSACLCQQHGSACLCQQHESACLSSSSQGNVDGYSLSATWVSMSFFVLDHSSAGGPEVDTGPEGKP